MEDIHSKPYLVTISDDTGSETHVVGLFCGAESRILLDEDKTCSMVLSRESLNRFAGNGRTCVGIREMVRLLRSAAKAPNRKKKTEKLDNSDGDNSQKKKMNSAAGMAGWR